MPAIEDIQPTLSSRVAQSGLADAAGSVQYQPTTESATAGEIAFGGPVAEFILYGWVNGSFAQGPPDSSANIEPVNNPLPYWYGPVQTSGGALTAQWETDSGAPSGYVLRLTMNPGAASDEGYFEQIVPIGSGSALYTVHPTVAIIDNSTGDTGMQATLEVQYLTAAGATTGSARSFTATNNKAAPATMGDAPGSVAVAPADAAYLRARIGMKRNTAATTASGTIDFISLATVRYIRQQYVPDTADPATYEPGALSQTSGTLLITPNGDVGQPRIALYADANANIAATTTVGISGTRIDLSGGITYYTAITPSQLTAATDDWNPTGLSTCSVIRMTSDAARSLRGIVAQENNRTIRLLNVGAYTITLVHDSTGTSTAANCFYCPGNANVAVRTNGGVDIHYDTNDDRWRVVSI